MKGKRTSSLLCVALLFISACTKTTERTTVDRFTEEGSPTPVTAIPQKGILTRSALAGDLVEVKRLVAAGADVNENVSPDTEPMTPLLGAITRGHAEVAGFLVRQGAQVNLRFRNFSVEELAAHSFGPRSDIVATIHAQAEVSK